MNCKTLCGNPETGEGNKCHNRFFNLIPGHLNSITCRKRKLYYGKIDADKFFRGELSVQIKRVNEGGMAIPYNGQLYVCIINNDRSKVVMALREKVASLFEFLC